MMNRYILALISAVFITSNTHAQQADTNKLIAQELTQLVEQDPDITMRIGLDNETIASFFDWVEKSKMIAQQDSSLKHAVDYYFYNVFSPSVFKNIILLAPDKTPQLHAMVQELCQKYELPIPPVFLARDQNSFDTTTSSFSTNTALLVLSKKMVDLLTDEQLKAILAQQLSHIKNNHTPKILALSGIMTAATIGYGAYVMMCGPDIQKPEGLMEAEAVYQHTIQGQTTKKTLIATAAFAGFLILMIKICAEICTMQEKEAILDALKVTANPDAFVAAAERIKECSTQDLSKTKEVFASLNKKIDELAQVSPWIAAHIKSRVNAYIKLNA